MVPEILYPLGICTASVINVLNCSDRYTQHSTVGMLPTKRISGNHLCKVRWRAFRSGATLLFLAVHTCSTSQSRMLSQSASSACLRSTWISCSPPTRTSNYDYFLHYWIIILIIPPCWKLFMSLSVTVGAYDPDQPGSGFLDILKGGTERFLTNIKDTSSKVIQSVARYRAPIPAPSTFIFPFLFSLLPVFSF